MLSVDELLLFVFGGAIWWLGVYILSRNVKSNVARLIFIFLLCISVYFIGDFISRNIQDYGINSEIWRWLAWSYILPIALIFHFSVVITQRQKLAINKTLLLLVYSSVVFYFILSLKTDLFVNYAQVVSYIPGVGYINTRGSLFWTLEIFICLSLAGTIWNYYKKQEEEKTKEKKYQLAILSSLLYLITGSIIVLLYYFPNQILIVQLTPYLILLPFIPLLISIFAYKLISDLESLFNIKEFVYLSLTILLICSLNAFVFSQFSHLLGKLSFVYTSIFLYITIFTHSFYDWLATFLRDLLYNAGKGFSLITDVDVNDLVRNFHTPEKIEASSIIRFKYVKNHVENGRFVDAAQQMIRDAIEYFKQSDFPRRTKQNLKYQIIKMTTLDEAEEGQILWELGFDGYPMKIMSGEDNTRKPLFKIESMSDYTASSRNAFIALKKEAIHDLAWRLSYLERTVSR